MLLLQKKTSFSSQMLISSLSVVRKKVKTTKELYEEMENRKLLNVKFKKTASNLSADWITQQQQQLQHNSESFRCASVCSDIAESDSCTLTSETSRDSGNFSNKTLGKHEQPLDNNSNYCDLKMSIVKCDESSSPLPDQNSTVGITTKLKQEIQEVLKLLTPPPCVKQNEYDFFNNIPPCTCTIEEVVADTNDCKDSSREISLHDANSNATNNAINNEKKSINYSNIEQMMCYVTEDVKGSNKDLQDEAPQLPRVKIKKSIFDLDFDDDEDPLNSIIADIVAKTSKGDTIEGITTTSPMVIEEKPNIPLSHDDVLRKVDHLNAQHALNVPNTSAVDLIVFPSYKVHYDPDCAAKNRFEVQTQRITKFHIDTLHNCYIPNVNGNWSHADFISNPSPIKVFVRNNKDVRSNEDIIIDGNDVVPLYGTDMNKQIVKDLSHIKFSQKLNNKHLTCKNKILFQIPFLGASHVSETKLCTKDLLMLNLEEKKENYDNKFNFNNICNKSAPDSVEYSKKNSTLANENDTYDAKEKGRMQNDNSSNIRNLKIKNVPNKITLKITKRNTSQVGKRFSIKRIKLALNGNLEASSDFGRHNTTPDDKNYYCVDQKHQVSASDLDSDSDLDYDEDHNYSTNVEHNLSSHELDEQDNCNVVNEFQHHAVINHDISDSSVGAGQNHHIVLTIRKNGSKTNSPLNNFSNLSSAATNFDGCCADKESACRNFSKNITTPPLSSSPCDCSDNKYEDHVLKKPQMQSEFERVVIENESKNWINYKNISTNCANKRSDNSANNDDDVNDNDLPEENNLMLLSFNKIYNKYTHEENAKNFKQQQKENKDHESNLLKQHQQFKNCDDYNNLNNNNNFNLIKSINDKTCSVNNNNHNNNTISCSNNYSHTNIISSSSSSNHENQTNTASLYQQHLHTNDLKPLVEYQTGVRSVDEGNNCGRLQQFKEWHEVLKLHSYNNELLTVLPYVVLE